MQTGTFRARIESGRLLTFQTPQGPHTCVSVAIITEPGAHYWMSLFPPAMVALWRHFLPAEEAEQRASWTPAQLLMALPLGGIFPVEVSYVYPDERPEGVLYIRPVGSEDPEEDVDEWEPLIDAGGEDSDDDYDNDDTPN